MLHPFGEFAAMPELAAWIIRGVAAAVFLGALAWRAEEADRRWRAALERDSADDPNDLRNVRPRYGG